MNKYWIKLAFFGSLLLFVPRLEALVLTWYDIAHSTECNGNKIFWLRTDNPEKADSMVSCNFKLHRYGEATEEEKAAYCELHYKAIQYLYNHMGESRKDIDFSITGPLAGDYLKITLETIAAYHWIYGNSRKAALLMFKYWKDSNHEPALTYAEENPMESIPYELEKAGMYKELAEFYSQAYPDKMKWLNAASNMKYFKTDFERYKKDWPSQAENYLQFMRNWKRAKELAKTAKPKPLDPAVQHHEWFYSDKQEEVLKALEYYHKFNVRFMLEKALKHKDPVIAAKAKEYLDNPVKEGAGNDKKK